MRVDYVDRMKIAYENIGTDGIAFEKVEGYIDGH